MFKNLHPFRINASTLSAASLEQALQARRFAGIGSQDMIAAGWVPPREHGPLVEALHGHYLMAFAVEKKLIPGAVVKRKLEEAMQAFQKRAGYRPGAKQKKALKDEILQALLPKAFTKIDTYRLWIDPKGGWFVVDGKPDVVTEAFIQAVDGVCPERIETERSPSMAMYEWLSGDAPASFSVDDECELKSSEGATVRYARLSLDRDDVREHLNEGKHPVKLAMTHDDKTSFVFTDKFEFKRLAWLDLDDRAANDSEDDAFESDFVLMAESVPPLIKNMIEACA